MTPKHLPKRHLLFLSLMLPFMSENLAARVQHVVAVRPDAVDVVAGAAEAAVAVGAGFVLHVLFEAVLGESLVFYVVGFVFFCEEFDLVLTV